VPPETFTGPVLSELFARAQGRLGDEAVMLDVRHAGAGRAAVFTVVAAAPGPQAPRSGFGFPAAPGPQAPRSGFGFPAPAESQAPRSGFGFPAPAGPQAPRSSRRFPAALTAFEPPPGIGDRPAVYVLVGPTGAGKTTTIAKLANHPGVFGRRRVGLLSLDTYRVGAIEQSRIYAELSRLPLEVVYEESDLPGALRRLADCDVVLVDTAGRSPRRREDLTATRAQLRRLEPREVHLVLPAGLRADAVRSVAEAHEAFGVTHLLATKLDEDPDDRSAYELARQLGLPMRWAATGQEVPRDLEAATARFACRTAAALAGAA
jgi:hypothetical protein